MISWPPKEHTNDKAHKRLIVDAIHWVLQWFNGLQDSTNNQALVSDGNSSLAFKEVITTEGGQTIDGLDISYNLNINGGTFVAPSSGDGLIYSTAANGLVLAGDGSSTDLYFATGTGSVALAITSSANVGVGTDSPNADLHVVGNAIISQGSGTGYRLQFDPGLASTNFITSYNDTGGVYEPIKFRASEFIIAGADGLTDFHINSSGNVGIGIIPNEKLHVSGNAIITGSTTLAGDLKIGTGASDYGWSDYLSSISAGKVAGSNVPSWSTFRDGINAYAFSATSMKEVWVNFHINHDFKLGTSIYPHVHWSPNTTSTGTVRWGIEYTIAKGHQQSNFGATTTVYVEQTISSADQYSHQIAEVASGISSTELEVDAVVMMRVFRDAAHANDDFPDDVFGLFVDLHVQVDRTSTLNKAPNFYS